MLKYARLTLSSNQSIITLLCPNKQNITGHYYPCKDQIGLSVSGEINMINMYYGLMDDERIGVGTLTQCMDKLLIALQPIGTMF